MPDPVDPLELELGRLLTLRAKALEDGNFALADLLPELAAKCLVKIGAAKTSPAPSQEPEQPVAQQEQIQPDEDDEPKT